MRIQQARPTAETDDCQEEYRLKEMVVELATLLEGICSNQVKTCKRVLDARDIPREMKDVLSDRIRSHEKDRQKIWEFLAKVEKVKKLK
ncbi:MAG: hypothetical protein WBX50_11520 [Candidatus Deferrimicrobiaceae bacterium]